MGNSFSFFSRPWELAEHEKIILPPKKHCVSHPSPLSLSRRKKMKVHYLNLTIEIPSFDEDKPLYAKGAQMGNRFSRPWELAEHEKFILPPKTKRKVKRKAQPRTYTDAETDKIVQNIINRMVRLTVKKLKNRKQLKENINLKIMLFIQNMGLVKFYQLVQKLLVKLRYSVTKSNSKKIKQ